MSYCRIIELTGNHIQDTHDYMRVCHHELSVAICVAPCIRNENSSKVPKWPASVEIVRFWQHVFDTKILELLFRDWLVRIDIHTLENLSEYKRWVRVLSVTEWFQSTDPLKCLLEVVAWPQVDITFVEFQFQHSSQLPILYLSNRQMQPTDLHQTCFSILWWLLPELKCHHCS